MPGLPDEAGKFKRRRRAVKPVTSADATEAAAAEALPDRRKRVKRHPEVEIAIGARIRALRVAAGISQGTLGTILGISFQQVQKYELGKDRVAASTLQHLAAALGVHPGSFFTDEAPLPPRSVPDVRDVVKIGQRIQRVGNPGIVKRLLSLADLLADRHGEPSDGGDDPP